MHDLVLEKLLEFIKADPQSSVSLKLYAPLSTLKMQNSGYLYSLCKLGDLSAEYCQLA